MNCYIPMLALLPLLGGISQGQSTRTEDDWNSDWQFVRDAAVADSSTRWESVTLPHAAKLEPINLGKDVMWTGDCLYRKVFVPAPSWSNKKVFLRFEGAMHTATVNLNGQIVSTHAGGYLPFQVELSGKVLAGSPNELTVHLGNRNNPDVPPGKLLNNADMAWYHGLYRNVSLVITGPLRITDPVAENLPASGGLFVSYSDVSAETATVHLKAHVRNDRPSPADITLRGTLADVSALSAPLRLAPGEAKELTLELKVRNPKLWSPQSPNLYPLRAEIVSDGHTVDAVIIRCGIRTVVCNAADGFVINGRKMFLRGTNRHQEYPYLGYALSDAAQWRDAYKIKQAGFDFVRLSHYPNAPAFLDACDYYGIVAMEPIPGWQFYKDGRFAERSLQAARDMIRRDRNHPACIFWETSLNETSMPKPFLKQLHEIAKLESPDTISASWVKGFHDLFMPARQHSSGPLYWDKWKDGNLPIITTEYGDWEYFANKAANFNQAGAKELKPTESSSRQFRRDGEKRLLQQALNFQEAHNQNHRNPAMIGDANWLFNDYNRGYATEHCASGVVDIFRLPKFVFYFYQSQRAPQGENFAAAMVFIASYWNSESPLNIRVFSNGEEVELLVNGQRIGRQKPDQDQFSTHLNHPPFTFKLAKFVPGELKAVAYMNGRKVAEHAVKTPGKPAKIRLTPDLAGKPIAGSAKDTLFVRAEIIDGNGTVIPDATLPVSFKLSNAELASPETVPAEAGIATALILTHGNGPVAVTASADGLPPAQIALP